MSERRDDVALLGYRFDVGFKTSGRIPALTQKENVRLNRYRLDFLEILDNAAQTRYCDEVNGWSGAILTLRSGGMGKC